MTVHSKIQDIQELPEHIDLATMIREQLAALDTQK